MPTYEYKCETCGIRFERWQRITDEPLQRCPECEGPVHRVPHAVGIVFKGSGFYCTDHRSSSSTGNGSSGAKAGRDSTDTKADKSDEAKPEKKD